MKLPAITEVTRIRYRLALALVSAAVLPVVVAIGLVETTVRQTSARFFVPEVGDRLDQSLNLYRELARATKEGMQYAATAIASDPELLELAKAGQASAVARNLQRQFHAYPALVSLTVYGADGRTLGRAERASPLNPDRENALTVVRALGSTSLAESAEALPAARPPGDDLFLAEASELETARDSSTLPASGRRLEAVFAADKAQFDAFQGMGRFVETYRKIERRRELDDRSYVYAFSALLGLTIVAAVGVGILLARGVTGRVSALAAATSAAAQGDLSVRVRETGRDEITDLAKGFNRMLAELETSRARIEYLQRMEAWQEMARRLAHEIKNPLTPIQLAVQDIHRRYPGGNPEYQKLLDTTAEIVEDEVGTLRRLVSEFSDFARLPQAELTPFDLCAFVREQVQKLAHERQSMADLDGAHPPLELKFEIVPDRAPALVDRQMLRRAFVNLIENARQALADSGAPGKVLVKLREDADYWRLSVEDNGGGIPESLRSSLFDPYVTTKAYGSGLGLAIVKKIVVDHGGRVAAMPSSLGGAQIAIWLPKEGSQAQDSFLSARKPASRPSHEAPPRPATRVSE